MGFAGTLRKTVNLWESPSSSLMKRYQHIYFSMNYYIPSLFNQYFKLSGFNTSNLSLYGKNYVIHGFIPAGGANHYRPSLREGSIVKVGSFEVIRCTNMYKITDHPFVIRIIPLTTIDEVARTLIVINLHKFMLQEFDHLQALATTNLVFPGKFSIEFCIINLNPNLHILCFHGYDFFSIFRCGWANQFCSRLWYEQLWSDYMNCGPSH